MRTYLVVILLSIWFTSTISADGSEDIALHPISVDTFEVKTYQDAHQLWGALYPHSLPQGVIVNSLTYTGYSYAQGVYKNLPAFGGIPVSDGMLLTTGKALDVMGPNDSIFTSGINDTANAFNDPEIDQLLDDKSYDAASLTVNFNTDSTIPGITFTFCYGTEEYSEWLGAPFNDIFCTFLDGENICIDDSNDMITVESKYFVIDNEKEPISYNLQYDGFTRILQCSAPLSAGSHTLKIAVADVYDRRGDSGVFLSNFKFEVSTTGVDTLDILRDQAFEVVEHSPGSTAVGKLATELAANAATEFTMLQAVPEFNLNSSDGAITVADGAVLDFDVTKVYFFNVEVTVNNTIKDAAQITVNILDGTDIQLPKNHLQCNQSRFLSAQVNNYNQISCRFIVTKSEVVTVELFNLSGRKIATLYSKKYPPGLHTGKINLQNPLCGIYFLQMKMGKMNFGKSIIVVK